MKVFKKISGLCDYESGLLKTDPFAGMKFKQPKTNRFLTKEELIRLFKKEFDIPRIALVRMFRVFCMTGGLARSLDVRNLKKEHIVLDSDGTYWIRKTRERRKICAIFRCWIYRSEIIRRYENHRMCKTKGIFAPCDV